MDIINDRRLVSQTKIDLKCSVVLIGDYKLGGQLLILPIEGSGRYKIKIHDIIVKVLLDIEELSAAGERFWLVRGASHSADVAGYVQYHFQNLFNGNRELADPVLKFSNENWRDIFHEVSPPIVRMIVSQIVEEITKFFKKVPIRMLALY